jgi:hypothetical protein
MGDRAREFAEELRLHWDDPYWWADHQLLQTVLACTIVGVLSIGFKYLELRMAQQMGATNAV